MNAYELAKYLKVAFYSDEDIAKAATMLCQQADRIAELEYKNELLVNRLEVITGVKEITDA